MGFGKLPTSDKDEKKLGMKFLLLILFCVGFGIEFEFCFG
jgi:hypothetical protein